jgi:hypothetical protein
MKYTEIIKNNKLTSYKGTKELVLDNALPRMNIKNKINKSKERQYILPFFDGGKQ